MSQNAIPIESGFNSESRVFRRRETKNFLGTTLNFQSGFDDLLKKHINKP